MITLTNGGYYWTGSGLDGDKSKARVYKSRTAARLARLRLIRTRGLTLFVTTTMRLDRMAT